MIENVFILCVLIKQMEKKIREENKLSNLPKLIQIELSAYSRRNYIQSDVLMRVIMENFCNFKLR